MTITTEYIGTRYAEAEKVDRNLRKLFSTYKGSIAMCRDYGIDISVLDLPTKAAEARLTSEIITAVDKYEPRAIIENIRFEYAEDGQIKTKVVWKLGDD